MKNGICARSAGMTALALAAAATLHAVPAAQAEECDAAGLGDLLARAAAASPALRAAAARLAAADTMPSQAGTLPDPEASVSYTNEGLSDITLGDSQDAWLSLTWTQEVPYPGKRRRAQETALAEVEMARLELARARLELEAEIKSAWGDLYRLDRALAVLHETRAVLESLAEAARRRYEVGEGIQESVLKAQVEIRRLEVEQERVAAERRAAQARINAAAGRGAGEPVGAVGCLPGAAEAPPAVELGAAVEAAAPRLRALEAAVKRGEATLERARLDLRPDLLWSGSYQYRGDLDPMVMGMFGVRLPLYRERKQAQAVAQAEAELAAARHELEEGRVRARAEAEEIAARADRSARMRLLIQHGVLPQAQGALDSARASYAVGRIGFLDLLEDLRMVLQARIDLAEQEAERLQALAALEPLIGRAIVAPPPGAAVEEVRP